MSSGSTNVREAPAALDELLKSIEDGQSSTKAVLDAYQDLLNKKTAPEIPPFQMGESKDFESPCWRAVYPEYLKKKRHCSAKDEKRWLQAEAIYGEVFGDKSVEEISVDDIEALKTRLKAKERTPRTIRGHLFNLRSFFKWAIKEGKTRCPNPCDDIEIPKAHQERDGSPFSHEEARRLLHACQEPVCREVKYRDGSTEVQVRPPPEHLPLAVHIALQTGLRKSNILRLTWRDPLCLRSLRQPLPRY